VGFVTFDLLAAKDAAQFKRSHLSASLVSLSVFPVFGAVDETLVVDVGNGRFALVAHLATWRFHLLPLSAS
jgi:hypothetical protein